MSERKTYAPSFRLSPHETGCATPRQSTVTETESGDDIQRPIQELGVTVHKTTSNRYGSTNISNNASAVLGNITHHNYFYGGRVPYLAGLQVYQEGDAIDPDTISDYDYRNAYWLRSEQRLEHTCEWIFEQPAYTRWLNNTGPPILIVSGTVGSGKSITASAVIDKLTVQQQRDTQLVVSYFVDHSREQSTTCVEILRALVKQVFYLCKASDENISKDLEPFLRAVFPSAQARPSAKAITSLLSNCMTMLKSCTFVIDGIDALPEREVYEFLDTLHELYPSTKSKDSRHKLIVFCRRSLGRGVQLKGIPSSAQFEIRLKNIQRDLFAFVDHEVNIKQGRRPITDKVHLIEKTKKVLKKHCGKMFLWIRLQISSLWDPGLIKCDDDINQQLSSLPEGLDEIYIRCLRRIEDNYSRSSREIAPKLFKWVACANESLTQLQAREAVSITAENIPLQKSQMLNTPAEDHCANLVTLDEISGKVVFPHPSVRDFLRNPLKVPPDLHHYLLTAETDELWCGEICLAYAHYLHTRKQVVIYKTTRVQRDIPTAFIKDVPGSWLSTMFRKPRPDQAFHMPLPTWTHRVGDLQESFLHDYMRRHWLSHNRQIKSTAPNYTTFATLCLGQDSQLQPWAAGGLTELEHYRKLFEFAVMTNHAPLFEVAVERLKHHTSNILPRILSMNCPGTDSPWVHVCAELGHKEVTRVVLRHCPKKSVTHGISAAVLALEHKNFDVFSLLIPDPLSGPVWTLSEIGLPKTYQVNLLRTCAMYGNKDTLDMLFNRMKQFPSREYLSDALLHACKYNTPEISGSIISAGADPVYLHLLEQDKAYYISQFSLNILTGSALFIAWHTGDLMLWNGIWTAQVNSGLRHISDENIIECLLSILGSGGALDNYLVFQLLNALSWSQLHYSQWADYVSLIWLEKIMQYVHDAVTRSLVHGWSAVLRKLLTAVNVSCMVCQIPTGKSLEPMPDPFATSNDSMLRWLQRVPDDILISVLKSDLIQIKHMLDPVFIEILTQRWSSRGLEAWLTSLGVETTLFWLRHSAGANPRVRLSGALERFAMSYGYSWTGSTYSTLLYRLNSEAIRECRVQVMDFLACYEFANDYSVDFMRRGKNLQTMLRAWDAYRRQEIVRGTRRDRLPSTLTWLRLYAIYEDHHANGYLSKMQERIWLTGFDSGFDGNFALNYPAGYYLADYESSDHNSADYDPDGYDFCVPAMSIATGLPVRRCIIEAIYRWNFRLGRKRRGGFSNAEIWYMALISAPPLRRRG